MNMKVNVIGAGFAGCEATWQLVKRGIAVRLYEMRPHKMTPAHTTGDFAELVCSNSFRADGMANAVGVLKNEMRLFDSLMMSVASETSVPAGGALAVDREQFAKMMTQKLENHPLVEIIREEIKVIPTDYPTIIATGPLTSDTLSEEIAKLAGREHLYFHDAAAPVITKESIDFSKVYLKSRYDKGEAAYLNCPMDQEEFEAWYDALIHAEIVPPKDFEKEVFFEGCMPFEEIARRGPQTLLYGPMKPVGLENPHQDNKRPHAVVQLRQDNAAASLYNIVGFQTHLKWSEQKRLIQMIPGLENAEIVRYGVMHKNTYIASPILLNPTFQSKSNANLFFAGQMTGVEGYVESGASGLLAGLNMARMLLGEELVIMPKTTSLGSLAYYITHADSTYFQPMNANFGLYEDLVGKVKKKEKKAAYAQRAIEDMKNTIEKYERV
ncbi:MAG: methylenetetrahydrofolate--tRNA-(uracil(54)-C(5))-methyltransferase (FADH(2)-oxidizing) TrmFO [Culicoidibacterales bacterium]